MVKNLTIAVLALLVLVLSTALFQSRRSTPVLQAVSPSTTAPAPTANATPSPERPIVPTVAPAATPRVPAGGFFESFDGKPTAPQPWQPANWDVTIHSRDKANRETLDTMDAMHGHDCAGPPATHQLSRYEQAVFLCNDHVMTALNADGYGMIYLTPNQLVDFSAGEAVISFDLSTERTSLRDWVDIWITPYEDNVQLVLEDRLPDGNGEPRNAIHIRMDQFNGKTVFRGSVVRDFVAERLEQAAESRPYDDVLEISAKRRDRFELHLSRTHVKFGMPDYDLWWIDTPIESLNWQSGVVQFGHHSYNPTKSCADCTPNTWHWDSIAINPARPFTIQSLGPLLLSAEQGTRIKLPSPAPQAAHLRFTAIGETIELSFDGGTTWQAAQSQQIEQRADERFTSYWHPIPAGTREVLVRGEPFWGGDWYARNVSVWAK
jgi:hypothetical protein